MHRANLAEESQSESKSDDGSGDSDWNHDAFAFICAASNTNEKLLEVTGILPEYNDHKVRIIVDTGASSSILSSRVQARLNIPIKKSSVQIRMANGATALVRGVTEEVTLEINDENHAVKFLVLDTDHHDILLGLDWLKNTGAIIIPGEGELTFAEKNAVEDPYVNEKCELTCKTLVEGEEQIHNSCWMDETENWDTTKHIKYDDAYSHPLLETIKIPVSKLGRK